MTDNQVLDALKESFADVRMDRPLERVLARGRGHRRQRRVAAGGTVVLAAGLAAATAAGLGGVASPARPEATPPHLAAAWSVATDKDGTITVELRHPYDIFDPSALRRALEEAGAPAVVRIGDCTWPSPDRSYRGEGFSSIGPDGDRTMTITPSKLPEGALVVFAIEIRPAPPGSTVGGDRAVALRAGVMAPGGTITCRP
ncbi:hypothetical protein [Phytohabitans suffuscus]|uniref:Uncharacterized protein n=1 Tax=Phytohabitans suffuscus TaxID=624315 RepID=A0A6F8Z0Z5_9ACTN|nr:hypothetical protein [Phytohabitans suffuscus]BCB92110.1 hypothetical protein Psuf_094230 [Phytohabitans suffuscus]